MQARVALGVDGLDACTFNAIQVIYTAAPRFRSGLSDPVPVRLGMLDGERDLVAVPEIRVEQRLKREAFTSLGPIRSAEGLGLLESPGRSRRCPGPAHERDV